MVYSIRGSEILLEGTNNFFNELSKIGLKSMKNIYSIGGGD